MLETKYNHLEIEQNKYENWKSEGYFDSGDSKKTPFTIVIPPPNITGKLHIGHAWDTALQDIIIRYKRMDGFDALWLPGMDHAGIATQAKIDAKLKSEGIKPREMTREEWLKRAWEWKEEYTNNIHEQWAKLGLSLDYKKERFTLDKGLSEAVNHVFITLYEKGLIYRGERIINWDPEAMTALSNEEVIYKEITGAFYHLKYHIEGTSDYLVVATTRPETLFGDTAVAINPKDERYKNLIGKNVLLPITNKPIPIIADSHANPEFGTGVVKITPAHDPNDFEVGNRHNLERIKCINPNGTMNDNAHHFTGLDRFDARKKLIEELKEKDLLIKIEEITHSVGHSERTDAMVEPYLSKQWFVKMDILSKQVLDNQKNTDTKVDFVPKRFEKILIHWMENVHDWCISRQLWWGHRIPAWYKGDELIVSATSPGDGWIQDADVLDTWFSSALWPFSTLGWPHETEDFKRYYPNNILVTGYDIIFFWVARMVFQGLEFTNQSPFNECLIHGLVRDAQGRKMSKSLGNGVDPMEVIEKYGADALRYFLTTSSAPGMDLRYDEEKIKATWNFANKLWNASRFVLMNLEGFEKININNLKEHDKWILTKCENTIKEVRKSMEKYEFNNAGTALYSFIWDDFCDSYIEMAKSTIQTPATKSCLLLTLTNILKMLHPFMPYITDEIYTMLPIKDATNIMVSSYPRYNKSNIDKIAEKRVENAIDFIKQFRNTVQENSIPKTAQIKINNKEDYDLIIFMLRLEERIIDTQLDINKYVIENGQYSMSIFYEKVMSKEEIQLIEKRIESLISSINRRKNLLSNQNYVAKAPTALVEKEKLTLKEEEIELIALEKQNSQES